MPRLLFVTLFACCATTLATAQVSRDFKKEVAALRKTIASKHIAPRPVDDVFSSELFDRFLEGLDPDGLYFSAVDLKRLEKYRTMLDDEINTSSWKFIPDVTTMYRDVLERSKQIIQKQSEPAFSFTAKSSFFADTTTWVTDEQALATRWRNTLHYQTLLKLTMLHGASITTAQVFQKQEVDARHRVKNMAMRDVHRALNPKEGFDVFIAEQYLEHLATTYDPHTNYFNLSNMEIFSALVSAEGFYFGFSLKENERGDVIISSLAPGGPAWRSGEFQLHDKLIALQWENEKAIDLSDLRLHEVNELLGEADQMNLKFTLQKSNGEVKTVTLQKEKLSQEQNLVRGYVLEGVDGGRYGYVVLPEFYSQWDSDDLAANRCANDVAKEIMKLTKEKIQGLIFDIRHNGGGSLKEAIALSGIFLEEGAMAMMRATGSDPISLKDMNRGTLYDGPLVVMVNGGSASASEIVAAVLQDYNRAVIVGGQTFGKATGQEVIPLNGNVNAANMSSNGNQGFAKITTSRIYRVTGKSLQGRGVIPDIILPDIIAASPYREVNLDHAIIADSIMKKSYYKPLRPLSITALRERSNARVSSSAAFKGVADGIERLQNELLLENAEVLTWDELVKQERTKREITEGLQKTLTLPTAVFKARVVNVEKARLTLDAYANEFHQSSMREMEKDIYLAEAFQIMNDLLAIK
ncbi:carboxy terminal-processing peptidase [Pseudochryseolinea flava]|uniref:PDZ domain-containing protein n=1 Tax=Pseudochryseolinea flava TaxID=2059302 RepID=A0A364Y1L9_9BACT|nr:carboxy terminal-processing peptidase [Pseudochryseolinea flava]RAW00557.1 hypothetical protein DQQ10_13235 [Pseudochryseolinea flava]